jgi:type 1 fimbria pilin
MPEAKTFGGGGGAPQSCTLDIDQDDVFSGQTPDVKTLDYDNIAANGAIVTINFVTTQLDNILCPWAVVDEPDDNNYDVKLDGVDMTTVNRNVSPVGATVELVAGVKSAVNVPAGPHTVILYAKGTGEKVYSAWLKVLATYCTT